MTENEVQGWSPARGRRLRTEAAKRLPPLRDGRRDPDRAPTDAPDREYAAWLAHLADAADDAEASG